MRCRVTDFAHAITVALLLLLPAVNVRAQEGRPNFTGTWRTVKISRGPVTNVLLQVEETASTFSSRPVVSHDSSSEWSVYPTDGRIVQQKRIGHRTRDKTGHWENRKLILEDSGEGNAPWRRSSTRQVISLSEDGRIMLMEFHTLGAPAHDYTISLERVKP